MFCLSLFLSTNEHIFLASLSGLLPHAFIQLCSRPSSLSIPSYSRRILNNKSQIDSLQPPLVEEKDGLHSM